MQSASVWFEVNFSLSRHCPLPTVPLRRGGVCPSRVQPAQQPHPSVKCACVFLWRSLTLQACKHGRIEGPAAAHAAAHAVLLGFPVCHLDGCGSVVVFGG